MGSRGLVLRAKVRRQAAPLLGLVSPRHRRWTELLRSCQLELSELPDVLPAPGPDDVIICGSPRTGTALLTAQLHQPPASIAVMEPWDVLRLPPRELFASIRTELEGGSLGRGRLDLDALEAAQSVRWCGDGEMPRAVRYEASSVVAVKYPGMWRYLDRLPTTKFVVCLRNPADTIRSFRTTGGRLLEGLQYDVPFESELNRQLSRISDLAERRVALYDTINRAIIPHLDRPEVHVVRYEDWFTRPAEVMAGLGGFLGRDLSRPPAKIAPERHRAPTTEDDFIARNSTTASELGY